MEIYTISKINIILIDFIEQNKRKENIGYFETIKTLKELIKEIEKEYKELGDK